ncbi:MAG: hypothetical protein K0S93_1205 [Nitrososphaeraceae archaeon]|nr:hypothetical protein [Nitrososphaeraceae archaeon]
MSICLGKRQYISKLKEKNIKKEYKDNFIYDWLQKSIPLNEMYNIFSDLYFNNEVGNEKIDNNKIRSQLNFLLNKNYPDYYQMLTEIRNKKVKHLEESKKNKKEVDKLLKRFQNQVDRQVLINKDTKIDPIKMKFIHNVAHARIVPKNWYKQLAKLAKESE